MNSTKCSIIITCYNCEADISECIDSLLAQDYPNFEIVLVNNGSCATATAYLEQFAQYKEINYVHLAENQWVTGGYNAGAAVAQGEILIFLNADTVAHKGWLEYLAKPLIDDPRIGISTPCILLYDNPSLINTCGNDVTWTGITVCRGLGEPASQWNRSGEVAAASGVALAIRRSLFDELGGFDDTLAFYYEDTDLSLRVRLAGYQIQYVPESIIQHKYAAKFSALKMFHLERNRWLTLFKLLRVKTFALLFPTLLLGEIMAWVFSILRGRTHLKAKWESWKWLWVNRETIKELRRDVQEYRKISDRELISTWSPRIKFFGTVPQYPARVLENLTYVILFSYGAVCRRIIAW